MLFLGLRSDSPIAFILLLFHSHADSLYTAKKTKSEPNLCENGKDWRYSDGRLILSYSIAFLDIKVIIIWLSKEKITYSGVGTQRQSIGFITRTISAYLKLYTGLLCLSRTFREKFSTDNNQPTHTKSFYHISNSLPTTLRIKREELSVV